LRLTIAVSWLVCAVSLAQEATEAGTTVVRRTAVAQAVALAATRPGGTSTAYDRGYMLEEGLRCDYDAAGRLSHALATRVEYAYDGQRAFLSAWVYEYDARSEPSRSPGSVACRLYDAQVVWIYVYDTPPPQIGIAGADPTPYPVLYALAVGRFVQSDSLSRLRDYRYVADRPTGGSDPLGLESIMIYDDTSLRSQGDLSEIEALRDELTRSTVGMPNTPILDTNANPQRWTVFMGIHDTEPNAEALRSRYRPRDVPLLQQPTPEAAIQFLQEQLRSATENDHIYFYSHTIVDVPVDEEGNRGASVQTISLGGQHIPQADFIASLVPTRARGFHIQSCLISPDEAQQMATQLNTRVYYATTAADQPQNLDPGYRFDTARPVTDEATVDGRQVTRVWWTGIRFNETPSGIGVKDP